MAGFMKNAMQYLGMADVAEDDEPMDIQDEDPGIRRRSFGHSGVPGCAIVADIRAQS